MPAIMIDGKSIADGVLDNLKVQLDALVQPLHMAAVCVGEDPGLRAFVKLKQKAAQAIGIEFSSYLFDGKSSEEVADALRYLAADEATQGIFMELPLPVGYDTDALLALIPASKDVDALTAHPLVPEPAVLALQYVLHEHPLELAGASVAVVGHGRLVGAPIAHWLTEQGARVSVIDITTSEPASIAATADLVIAATGAPGLVTAEWIKEGAMVIDFGYGKAADGTYVGDVERESVQKKAGLFTPVPGGMGPLLIAAVLENLLTLSQR